MQPFTPAIAKAVQSDKNVINVDIENYDPEITLGTYSVELRDLNNNLLDQVNITEKTEQVSLHPGRIMGKIYVVTLCNDGNPVIIGKTKSAFFKNEKCIFRIFDDWL